MIVEAPFGVRGNERYLTREQIFANPWLERFVLRFRDCFERDHHAEIWWYRPPENA